MNVLPVARAFPICLAIGIVESHFTTFVRIVGRKCTTLAKIVKSSVATIAQIVRREWNRHPAVAE